MTGLDVDNDVIIEIFCIITNGNLDVLDEEGWGAVIHQEKETMDMMASFFCLCPELELIGSEGRMVHAYS
jgi:oligoribonuclease (3'-5' exoribonuclease)